MGRVNWFEIHADDVKRANEFYKKVFGWKMEQFGSPAMEYYLATTGDDKTPGINGAIMKRMGPHSVWNIISVEDIDKAVKAVEKAGGMLMRPKMEIPNMGWVAYCVDTEGNVFGIHQAAPGAKM
jgi:predicted enzyme related to lactoylglutathione lyase